MLKSYSDILQRDDCQNRTLREKMPLICQKYHVQIITSVN